jgi:hypothetical protein
VQRLVEALAARGLRVWFDEAEIRAGEPWANKIETALRSSTHFVSIITQRSARSNWASFELGAALGLHKSIIPVVADDVAPAMIPGPARIRRYIVKADPAIVADEIVRGIAGEHETKQVD